MTEREAKKQSELYTNAYPHYVRPCESASGFVSTWIIISYLKDCIRVIADDGFDKHYLDVDKFNLGVSL